MAGKYWWEEDEENSSNQPGVKPSAQSSTQSEKKYWWEEDTDQSGGKSLWWDDGKTTTMIGENVTNRVNSWRKKHNFYISGYQQRYEGRKGNYEDAYVSDSADWLNTVNQWNSKLNTEAEEVLSYLDQFDGYLDEKWVNEVKETITGARGAYDLILEASTKDNEWWNNFADEELVKQYGSAEDVYKYYQRSDGYSKKYDGLTSTELGEVLSTLDDGEEKDWLNSYKASVYNDEMLKYDTATAEKKLKTLETALSEYGTLHRYYDMYQANPEAYSGSEYENIRRLADTYLQYQQKFGSQQDLDKLINDTKRDISNASQLQKLAEMQSVADPNSKNYDPNFGLLSQYVSNVEYGLGGKPSFTDDTYAYINNPTVEDRRLGGGETTARGLIEWDHDIYASDTPMRNRDSSYERDALDYIKPEEVAVYNYYYATEGEAKANEYLDALVSTFKTRRDAETVANASKFANEHPRLSSVLSVGTSIGSGFEYLEDVIEYGGDKLFGKDAKLDTNEAALMTNAVRNTVTEQVDWEIGNWDAFDFLYNTTMSGADSLASIAFGGLGGTVLGLSAAAQGTNDALQRGMSNEQAFWNGIFSGAFEGIFETISIGQFNALKEVPLKVGLKNLDKTIVKDIFKNLGKSMLVNATEEMATEIANIAYDTLMNGEFANYTIEELENGAWKEALNQVLESGASGALMGMGMGTLGTAVSHHKGVKAANEYAFKNYGGNTDAFIQEGLANDKKSDSYKIAQKYQNKVDGGKKLTGAEIRKLLAANQDQITPNDMKKIQQAAEKRLTDLGQTEDVSKLAELATRYATGQKLSKAEKSFLASSKYGSRVYQELLPKNIASEGYTTGWAEEIGTKQVNAAAYNKKAIRELVDAMANTADPSYKSLESRMETETPAQVSNTGKAVIRATGKEIDLSAPKIKTITEDSVVLDVNGEDVDISEIDFPNEDQWNMFNALKKIEHITPVAANSMIAKLDMTKPIWGQLNGMDEAFTYGFHNYSEADLKAGLFTENLTPEQLNDAFKLGHYVAEKSNTDKQATFKQMRTAAQAQAEKAAAEGKASAMPKNLTITYNQGGGKVVSIDEAGITDAKQSGAVEVAKILHRMGLGTKVEFFASHLSETMKDKKGNPARVFINDKGVEQRAYSGVYRKSDGTIRVDLNAYNGRGLTLNALAHELTHFIQQWSDRKYKVLVDFLMKEYEKTDMTMHERVLAEQARLKNIRGEDVSYDEAYDEVVANAMSKMFDDGKLVEKLTKLKEQDKNLAQKLWEGFKKIMSKFLGIYQNNPALFKDAADLMAMKDTFEQLQNMFAEALVEASENYQAYLTASESQALTEAGIGFDADTRSVYSLHFSTAYQDVIQVGKKKFDTEAIAQIVAKGTGRSIADARKWVNSELTIANMVMENPEFLDFEADNRYEAIKKNSDYPQGTVDLSNLCPKREEFTTMFDMLQKKYPNKLFTAQDVAEMRKILSDNDITVACGACFVEDRRQLLGEIADTFINMWKEAVDTGKPLQKTNAAGNKSELLVTKALAKQYGITPGTKIMAADTYIPTQYDLTTYEGFKLLEKNHPTIAMAFNRYNNSRGQQSARLIEGRAEYNRQILGWSDAKVRSVNNNGGLRIFSFSDFEVVHLLDLVQVIIDCAAKGVKIQGYTKIPAFAKLVSGTGIKLNRSLIPKGDYGFHMENGKVVLDYDTVEGIDIHDKNFLDESNNPDVGNIVIGINPTQIGAAMIDPFIDYIIPFHSNKAKAILKKLGTGEWVNYKESQHEKDISTGTASKRNVNIYTEVINKYHPTNKVEFVEAFLKECKKQGKIPRYAEFLNVDENGDYAYREGYHKLLVDFKMFDADGNILPQGNITPNLDDGFMAELMNAEIDRKQNYEFPQKVYDAIDKQFGEQYSSQETDADRQQYNPFREKFTKERLDLLSDRLGKLFPLSAGFEQAIQNDKTPVSNMTIVANSQKRNNGESFYTVAKKAFKKLYGAKTTFSIKQLGINADADDSFARESIAKASDRKDMQTILDLTPAFKQLIEDSRLLAVERLIHNDKKEKSLLCYRLYNAYIREETYIDANGKKQTQKVPHIVVFSVIQNLADAKAYMVTDIKDVAISNGHNSSKLKAAHANGNISIANIADVYGVVKSIDRKKGGLRYSPGEMAYKFDYTQKESGEVYSSQETDADNAPTFYSKMGKVVEGMKPEKFGASSVISMLRGRGVKAEEIRWSGIQAFLEGKKSVTKQELLDFINSSMLHIEETMLDGSKGEPVKLPNNYRLEETENGMGDPILNLYIDDELVDTFEQIFDGSISSTGDSDIWAMNEEDLTGQILSHYAGMSYDEAYGNGSKETKWDKYTLDGGDNYRELLFKMPGAAYDNQAMEAHWGDHGYGVLAHARIQDFNTFIGKMLFIEEIQSDWHNAGQKEGYRKAGEKTAEQIRRESDKAYREFYGRVESMFNGHESRYNPALMANLFEGDADAINFVRRSGFTDEEMKYIKSAISEETARKAALESAPSAGAVPDAPFKDNYHEYVLKRLLRMAAEEGYDSIGWTTADIQSERWSSEYAEGYRIEYDQDIPKFLKKYGKQWGTNVGKTVLDNGTEVWSMAITDSMQKSVLKDGQELYSSQETDLDSNGKQLGEDQLEYFENSQARDRNGRLQVVYHGGTVEFEFDTTRGGKGATQYGPGAYFTDSEYYAKEYTWYRGGNVKDYYLKIEKMFDDTNMDATVQMPQWKKLEQILRDNGIEEKFINGFANNGFAYMSRYLGNKAGITRSDSWGGSEILNGMIREAGFDGIKGTLNDVYQYAIFTPNQAKLTTNEVPSAFYDTRYSEHDTDYSNRSLLANAFEWVVQNSEEYKLIQEYKDRIKLLNEQEAKLDKLNAEIREIRFGTTGPRDTARLRELEADAKNTAQAINRHDKKLLSLEASEPLRKVIERERKKEAQKTKDHVKEIQQNKKLRAEQTELRHKIRKAIRDLDKILNRGNKKLNVKEDMQPVVTKALQAAEILFTENYGNYDMLRNGIGTQLSDNEEALVATCTQMLKDLDKMPTDGYENWQARQEAENRLRTKMSKLNEVFARERKRLNNTTVSSILGELADAYAAMRDSQQSYVQGAYSEPVYNFLKNLQTEVGGTIVQDMTKNQLEFVYKAYKMVLESVRNANRMFNEELKQSREQLGNAVIEEVINAGGVHLLGTKLGDAISQFDWNNMKPIWLANRIGSDTFGKLMNGLFKGQYNFAVDIDGVKQFKLNMDEKYHPRNWDADKLYEFESSTGKKFSLNLQQIMSLYAFSKREQSYSHLLNGGFVFEDNSTMVVDGKLGIKKTYIHKGASSYKLNVATLNGIINSLTAEQKAYVDEMQKYLSDVMGAKGNEVSMKLYGIEMFKEKFYFPLRSSGAYMEKAKEAEMKKQQGQINLVNSGFTHSVKPEAKNPIILSGFMDVWSEHCNEMSMYHSMVLPMEDFRKVYNYSTIHDENMESASVYQTIQDAYGKEATSYIDQLYRELNAGATVDPRETPWKKLISNFKKSAVMLSGSVFVQQFSSIGRAYAVIDPKYFIGTKVNSDTKLSSAEEMKKYAPVAIIKEMGGFDTGTKGNAKSYIMAEKYGIREWRKALKDEQFRGDIMGYLPAWADQKTWAAIWEAVKRETKAKNPKMEIKSEEFLKLAGERFSEVIEKTQVYDSVLARSANMRSKGNFMAMATAFMAEPTTTVNLIEDAIRSGKAKNIARAFGSVAVSIVLNNALSSIVYAMRDDDEDETFLEKYFQSFTSGMIDDLNPMSYYPFLKDVYSLFQGYDVERTDMAVFADVRDALKRVVSLLGKDTSEMNDDQLAEHNKQINEVFMGLLDAGCSAFGVPMKNVRRDAMAIVNGIKTVGKDLSSERDNSWISFWDKVGSAAKDTIPIYAWTKDTAKTDKLYDAILSGDKDYLARLKSTYKTEDAYQNAVRKALRENDSRIHDAAQARYEGRTEEYKRIFREIQKEGKFSFDDIMSAVNSEESKIRNGVEPDKATSDYTASGYVEAIILGDKSNAKVMKEDIISTYVANGKTQKEAEQAFTSAVTSGIREAYSSGLLDQARAKNMLMEYTDRAEEEAVSKVNYWAFCEDNPKYKDVYTESHVAKYNEYAKPAGVSVDVYAQFINGTKGLETIRDEWGDVEVSLRDQVLEVIDSLPLTWQQKDALYLAYGYAENKIWDVPW